MQPYLLKTLMTAWAPDSENGSMESGSKGSQPIDRFKLSPSPCPMLSEAQVCDSSLESQERLPMESYPASHVQGEFDDSLKIFRTAEFEIRYSSGRNSIYFNFAFPGFRIRNVARK